MTSSLPPREQDLAALWQSDAPDVNVEDVMRSIGHDARIHRRFNGITLGVAAFVMIFLFWMEVRGFFRVPFVLSGAILLSLLWKVYTMRRASSRMSAVGSLGTTELVRHAIARARTSLRTGRILYAVNPLSLVAGIAVGPLFSAESAVKPDLDPVTAGVLLGLIAMIGAGMVVGIRMARAAQLRLGVLEERLQSIEKDL
jgi:threonine/homoserine/homoserine lactone efflux protein